MSVGCENDIRRVSLFRPVVTIWRLLSQVSLSNREIEWVVFFEDVEHIYNRLMIVNVFFSSNTNSSKGSFDSCHLLTSKLCQPI